MTSEPAKATPEQRDALSSLSHALTSLAGRFRSRAAVEKQFAALIEGAAAIALKARDVYTSRWSFDKNAAGLAAALIAFVHAAETASARASEGIRGTLVAADALVTYADRIATLSSARAGPSTPRTLKDELEPLEAVLIGLQDRMKSEGTLVGDARNLSTRAVEIGGLAEKLELGGREAQSAALAVSQAMTVFAHEITSVADRFASASGEFSDVADLLAANMRNLAKAKGRPGNQSNELIWT